MDIKKQLEQFRSLEVLRESTQQDLLKMQQQTLAMHEFPKLSNVIGKATHLLNEIESNLVSLETELDAIFLLISNLEKPLHKTVILEKYIKCQTVKETAKSMQCSDSTVLRLLTEALDALQKISA